LQQGTPRTPYPLYSVTAMAIRIRNCRNCGRDIDDCGPLSARKLCAACGEARMVDNALTLAEHGPWAVPGWREGMARAAGIKIVPSGENE
jgi:hypothetical protein